MKVWLQTLERYRQVLSDDTQSVRQLSDLRGKIEFYVADGQGSAEDIESDIRSFAAQNQDRLMDVVELIAKELLEVADEELADLRRAKKTGNLSDAARSQALYCASVLQDFMATLNAMTQK